MNAYETLENRWREIAVIDGISGLIGWDMRVNAPANAAATQSEQMAYLAKRRFDLMTAPDWADVFAALDKRPDLTDFQRANTREAKREWIDATSSSPENVEAFSKAVSAAQNAWSDARKNNDFKSFKEHLKILLQFQTDWAEAKSERTGLSVYDALLDGFQPGMTSARIDGLFAELKAFLPALIARAKSSAVVFGGDYSEEKQKEFVRLIMKRMGFDFSSGRLDWSDAAFCTSCGFGDERIVARFKAGNPLAAVAAVMHETGHALYELGLDRERAGQPAGRNRGMAVHESMSILMERPVMKSDAFLRFLSAEMTDFFGQSDELSFDFLKKAACSVTPSLIRIDADEVTYPMHIIVRYEIEKALFDGTLQIDDIPAAWNEKMRAYLGVVPETDADGCLQDIHWACGSFGYFPDYAVGAIAAAQFFAAAKRDDPSIESQIGQGDFSGLNAWLDVNVRRKGSVPDFEELIETATGEPLSAAAYRRDLETRYG